MLSSLTRMKNISAFVFFIFFQWLSSLTLAGLTIAFPSLFITLAAVACAQFEKLKAAILDITPQHITPHNEQQYEQVRTDALCDMQAKIIKCIRHHQEVLS